MDVTRLLCILGNSSNRSLVKEVLPSLLTEPILFYRSEYGFEKSTSAQKFLGESTPDTFYKSIGKSIFSNFDAVIAANINVMYDIFSLELLAKSTSEKIASDGGSLAPQFLYPKRRPICLHLNARNFGLSEYLQYKIPLSFIYINLSVVVDPITLNKEMPRLGPDVSSVLSGESYDKVALENPDGLDLIYHDEESTDYNILRLFKYSKLLRITGKLVFKINCRVSRYLEYLTLAYYFFEEINLFKPCSIDLFDPYLYVICKGYRPNQEVYNYAMEVLSNLQNHLNLSRLKEDDLSVTGLIATGGIKSLLDYIGTVVTKIKELREVISKDGRYFAPRALVYWGLPGTPE